MLEIKAENATDTQLQHRLRKAELDKKREVANAAIRARATKAPSVNEKETIFEHESKINSRRKIAKGGGSGLGFNRGGMVTGGSTNIKGVEELRSVVETFSRVVNGLADKLSGFKDMSISLQATHKVEVTFNGAEVLSKLAPEIQKMAIAESKKAINNMIDSKFPDVGRIS
jgi:hypothetical protein